MADNSTAPPAALAAALADRYRIERPNGRIYIRSAHLSCPRSSSRSVVADHGNHPPLPVS
jgi:hypothetical protein